VPLQSAHSPLVAGGTGPHAMATTPPPVKVRALRAFLIQGKRVEPGTVVELPRLLATDLVTNNKAVLVTEAAKQFSAKPAGPQDKAPPKSDTQGSQP
jgi:hypothetical protein